MNITEVADVTAQARLRWWVRPWLRVVLLMGWMSSAELEALIMKHGFYVVQKKCAT